MNISTLRDLHNQALVYKQFAKNTQYNEAKASYLEYSKLAEQIRKYDSLFCMDLCSFERYAQNYFNQKYPENAPKVFFINDTMRHTEEKGKDYAGNAISRYSIPVKYSLMVLTNSESTQNVKMPVIVSEFSLTTNHTDPAGEIEKIQDESILPENMRNVKINLLTNDTLHLDSYYGEATDLNKYGIDASDLLWGIVDQHARHLMECKRAENESAMASMEQDNQSLSAFDDVELAMSR